MVVLYLKSKMNKNKMACGFSNSIIDEVLNYKKLKIINWGNWCQNEQFMDFNSMPYYVTKPVNNNVNNIKNIMDYSILGRDLFYVKPNKFMNLLYSTTPLFPIDTTIGAFFFMSVVTLIFMGGTSFYKFLKKKPPSPEVSNNASSSKNNDSVDSVFDFLKKKQKPSVNTTASNNSVDPYTDSTLLTNNKNFTVDSRNDIMLKSTNRLIAIHTPGITVDKTDLSSKNISELYKKMDREDSVRPVDHGHFLEKTLLVKKQPVLKNEDFIVKDEDRLPFPWSKPEDDAEEKYEKSGPMCSTSFFGDITPQAPDSPVNPVNPVSPVNPVLTEVQQEVASNIMKSIDDLPFD